LAPLTSSTELAEAVVSEEATSNTNCAFGSPSASSVSGPVSWADDVKRYAPALRMRLPRSVPVRSLAGETGWAAATS